MASILGMSCGLGMFAVFRVNRDPILLLPSAAPPLLVFSNAAPMAPSEPAAKSAALAPFDTRFTVTLPPPSAAPPEPSIPASTPGPTAGAEPVAPAPFQVSAVMARAEPTESRNAEVTKAEVTTADVASTEAAKAEGTTADVASTEVTKAEATTADAASTEVTKAEANRIKASELSSGDRNRGVPTIVSVVETSGAERSLPGSVSEEKTARPASAKKTVGAKARARSDSAKFRAKTSRIRVRHTAIAPRTAHPDEVVQFAQQTFAAQPVYQYWPTQPAKAVTIRRGRHRSSR